MWDRTAEFAPVAVFLASLLGSAHCAGMCGPFTLLLPKSNATETLYHLGRLISYACLGALAGALGNAFLGSLSVHAAAWAATLLMSFAFLFTGLALLLRGSLHVPKIPGIRRVYKTIQMLPDSLKGLALGLVSVLLPCGWLYGFVLGAIATGSAWKGAVFLVAFWLGTVPALLIARKLIGFVPKYAAVFLILAGFVLIGLRMGQINHSYSNNAPSHVCH